MKRISFVLSVILVVLLAGCQPSQEKQTTEVSRKDRLVGNENMNIRNELKKCREEIEKQKSLVRKCEEDKEKADRQCGDNIKWLMDELPEQLLNDSAKLTEENANLLARIAGLENQLQQYKAPQQK